MADNTISVSVGITKNIGNYESLRLDASTTRKIEDGKYDEAWKKLWKEVQDQIEAQLLEAQEVVG